MRPKAELSLLISSPSYSHSLQKRRLRRITQVKWNWRSIQ